MLAIFAAFRPKRGRHNAKPPRPNAGRPGLFLARSGVHRGDGFAPNTVSPLNVTGGLGKQGGQSDGKLCAGVLSGVGGIHAQENSRLGPPPAKGRPSRAANVAKTATPNRRRGWQSALDAKETRARRAEPAMRPCAPQNPVARKTQTNRGTGDSEMVVPKFMAGRRGWPLPELVSSN